jgi:hypothetical protein
MHYSKDKHNAVRAQPVLVLPHLFYNKHTGESEMKLRNIITQLTKSITKNSSNCILYYSYHGTEKSMIKTSPIIPSLLIYFSLFIAKHYLCFMKFLCGNVVHKQMIRSQHLKPLPLKFSIVLFLASNLPSANLHPLSSLIPKLFQIIHLITSSGGRFKRKRLQILRLQASTALYLDLESLDAHD